MAAVMAGAMLQAAAQQPFTQNSLMQPGPGGIPLQGPPPGWNYNPQVPTPGWANQGMIHVVACGYDARGVWRVLPLYVSYQWNGVQYSVTVMNAWNPWTQSWDNGVDMPAYNTSYYMRGINYNFYAPLTTGTYYFNL